MSRYDDKQRIRALEAEVRDLQARLAVPRVLVEHTAGERLEIRNLRARIVELEARLARVSPTLTLPRTVVLQETRDKLLDATPAGWARDTLLRVFNALDHVEQDLEEAKACLNDARGGVPG